MNKLLLVLLAAFALPLHGASVTAEGWAAGDLPNARELQIQIAPSGIPSDFEITGDLTLRHTGRETLHNSPLQNVFTLHGGLRAIQPDTGEVLAIAPFEASRKIPSPLSELPVARQNALERALRPPLKPTAFPRSSEKSSPAGLQKSTSAQ